MSFKEYDTQDETIYQLMKEAFSYLGLDKSVDDKTFKAICAKYKGYFITEAEAWKK